MIPLHSLALILMGRFSSRLYVAYSSWYAVGTLASMQVPFVGFQPVRTSEHMAALGMASHDSTMTPPSHIAFLGVFGLLQIIAFAELVRSHVSSKQFQTLLFASVIGLGVLGALGIVGLTYKGWIAPWTGRFYSLWDTGYAKKYVLCTIAGDCPIRLTNRYPGTFQSSRPCLNINRRPGHRSSWICISWSSSFRRAS